MRATRTLELIKGRFGGQDETIERAFKRSKAFRALCGDYVACVTALARWQRLDSEEARLREAEYSELLEGLTQEIEMRLGAVYRRSRP